MHVPVGHHLRDSTIEIKLAADRGLPGELAEAVRTPLSMSGRFGRCRCIEPRVIAGAVRLFVPEGADLVLLRRLPREAKVRAAVDDQGIGLVGKVWYVRVR